MKFTITVSEDDFNTIITALRFEQNRVKAEGDKESLKYINHAIEAIDQNTYVANCFMR
jgi:hypothetical protein